MATAESQSVLILGGRIEFQAPAVHIENAGGYPMLMKLVLGLLASTLAFGEDLPLTIAALSLSPEPWNKQANLTKLEKYVRQAAGMGAQLVIAPEGFLEGYVGNQGRSPGLTRE